MHEVHTCSWYLKYVQLNKNLNIDQLTRRRGFGCGIRWMNSCSLVERLMIGSLAFSQAFSNQFDTNTTPFPDAIAISQLYLAIRFQR